MRIQITSRLSAFLLLTLLVAGAARAQTPLGPTSRDAPAGGLMYEVSDAGAIVAPGQQDWTIDVEHDAASFTQTITVIVESAVLEATVSLLDPSPAVIATDTAGAPGESVILQTVPTTSAGTYTVRVADGVFSGAYTVTVILNAAAEEENWGGATNDILADAQDINASFVSLGGTAARGAVLGGPEPQIVTIFYEDFEAGLGGFTIDNTWGTAFLDGLWHLTVRRGADAGHSATQSLWYGDEILGTYNVGDTSGAVYSPVIALPASGAITLSFNHFLEHEGGSYDRATVEVDAGAGYVTLLASNLGTLPATFGGWVPVTVDLSAYAGSNITLRFGFDTIDSIGNNYEGWFVDDVRIEGSGLSVLDFHTFDLAAGEAATIAATALGAGTVGIEFYDGAGTPLAAGTAGAANVDEVIENFVSPAADTYYVRVQGDFVDYSLVVTRGATFDIEPNDSLATAQDIGAGWTALGEVGGATSDYYSFPVNSGDTLDIGTSTPGDGAGEFPNTLDPGVELFDPSGMSVAIDLDSAPDGWNALISGYLASDTGSYTVRVYAEANAGEYVVTVQGSTGTPPPLTVTSVDPADGAQYRLTAVPTQVTVDFSEDVLVTSLVAGDLTVDAVPATGFTVVDADTVTFDVTVGAAVGMHTVTIAADDITGFSGGLIQAFSSQFELLPPPKVISSSITQGATVPAGALTYTAGFDEEMDDTVLDATDFWLVGATTGLLSPDTWTYDTFTSTVTVEYSGLLEDSWTLTLRSGDGRFEDIYGVNLDGSPSFPLPSGDDVEGGNFLVNFVTDVTTLPYPTPLNPVNPGGSLVYDGSVTTSILPAADVDNYTIDLDAGQVMTVVVVPPGGLQPAIEVFDPNSVSIGSVSAAGPGDTIFLQTLPVTDSGTYTITVNGDGVTTGPCDVQVTLNAAVEEEPITATANDASGSAESIDGSSVSISASADRIAVFGDVAGGQEDWFSFTLAAGESATLVLAELTGAGSIFELWDDAANLLAVADTYDTNVALGIENFVNTAGSAATYYARIRGTAACTYDLVVTRGATFDVEDNDTLADAQDIGPGLEALGHVDDVPADVDVYRFEVNSGDSLTITTATPGDDPAGEFANQLDPLLELYDENGVLVAFDNDSAADGRNAVISHTAASSGTYTALVRSVGGEGEYVVSVAGATGARPPFEVVDNTPADGERLPAPPATFTVTLSEMARVNSVDAAKLKVDGADATFVTQPDGSTLVFTLPGGLAEGQHTVTIAADAITGVGGQGIQAFSSTFWYDATAPKVTDIWLGGEQVTLDWKAVTLPSSEIFACTATFDEDIDTTFLDPADITLIGARSGAHAPLGWRFDGTTDTLTIEYWDLPEDSFTLTLRSGNLRFEDVAGNDLDGEPNWPLPSGNGTAGGDFVVNFTTDNPDGPYPTPLAPRDPRGSLVYDGSSVATVIIPAADEDSFTIDLDAGQTIGVVVVPEAGFQAEVEVFDPVPASLGSASAAPGQPILLQPLPVAATGTYTVTVRGLAGTTGQYDLSVTLNALVEEEEVLGIANNTLVTAQSIEGGFLALPGASAGERAAVAGVAAADVDWYGFDLAMGQTMTAAVAEPAAGDFDLELYDSGGTLITSGTTAASNVREHIVDFVADADGTYYLRVTGDGGDYVLVATRDAAFDIEWNDSLEGAQDITRTGVVLGAVAGPGGPITEEAEPNNTVGTANILAGSLVSTDATTYQASVTGEIGDAGGFPLTEGFESGALSPAWSTSSSAGGQIQLTGAYGTHGGAFALLMDNPGAASLNEAVLTVDLSGASSPTLSFWHAEWGDENHFLPADFIGSVNGDGVAISDNGVNWHTVVNCPIEPFNGVYSEYVVDLAAEAAAAGMTLGPNFRIKFQQYDTIGLPNDGRGWDDITVTGAAGDAQDCFLVSCSPGDCLTVEVAGVTLADPLVSLLDDAGAEIASDNDGGDGLDAKLVFADFPYAGVYYIVADAYSITEGTYTLTVTLVTSSPIFAQSDFFRFEVNSGDALSIATATPSDGPGEFVNELDPALELLDPTGAVVATDADGASDGCNAVIAHTAASDGTYTVRVLATSGEGEYVLEVTGCTGSPPPFVVDASAPADGDMFSVAPTQMDVDFSDSVLASSLDAGDLTVDGTDAAGFTPVDGDTVRFDLPALAEGVHAFEIAAAAVTSIRGDTLAADYTGSFTIDLTAPQVTSSSIQDGDTLTDVTGLIYQVGFDEDIRVDTLDPSDFRLLGATYGLVDATGWSYDSGSQTLTIEFDALPEDDFTLTLFSGNNMFEDVVGNDLDGEPNWPLLPSGGGTAGGDFVVDFTVDIDVAPAPRLEAVPPFGSMIYSSLVGPGRIWPLGDTDSFEIDLDAGQTLTVWVETGSPDFQPTIDVRFGAASVASATAIAQGRAALVQNCPVDVAGTYTVIVGGTPGHGTGPYDIATLGLNAAVEDEERLAVGANDGVASAQDIEGSFIPLDGNAERGAVVGRFGTRYVYREDFELGLGGWTIDNTFGSGGGLWHLSTGRATDGGHTPNQSIYYGQNEGDSGGGDYDTGLANGGAVISPWIVLPDGVSLLVEFDHFLETQGSTVVDIAEVAIKTEDETDWTTILSTTDGSLLLTGGNWDPVSYDISSYAGETVQFRLSFDTVGATANDYEGWYVDDFRVRCGGGADDNDCYSFTLEKGESVTAVATPLGGAVDDLEIFDDTGRLATGYAGYANVGRAIDHFVAPEAGTYYVRVSGGAGGVYSLVLTLNAAFDLEMNDSPSDARSLSTRRHALGYVGDGGIFVSSGGSTITEIDYESGRVTSQSQVPAAFPPSADGLALQGDSLFMLNLGDGSIWEFDAVTETLLDVDPIGQGSGAYRGLASVGGLIYVCDVGTNEIIEFDPATDEVTNVLGVGELNPGVAVGWGLAGITGPDALLLIDDTGDTVHEIDPSTGIVTNSFGVDFVSRGLAVVGGTVFVGRPGWAEIHARDRQGDLLYTLDVPFGFSSLGGDGTAFAASALASDVYKINLSSGSSVTVSTLTPMDGPDGFDNVLDPMIEVYNSGGALVASNDNSAADGRNAHIGFTGSGLHYIRIRPSDAAGPTRGEYVLTIQGGTLLPDPFNVDDTIPAGGESLAAVPAWVEVVFDADVLPTLLDPTKLTVDGLPATAAEMVSPDTVRYGLPEIGSGTHILQLAQGAVVSIHGQPCAAYGWGFSVLGPRVIFSSVQEGDVLPPGALLIVVAFSADLDATDLDETDLRLEGAETGLSAPTWTDYIAGTRTFEVFYSNLPEDSYALTLFSGDGMFEGVNGFDLDGEPLHWPIPPNVSGDREPGGDFYVNFNVVPAAGLLPDLIVSSVTADPAIADVGDVIVFSVVVQNVGAAAAGPFGVGFWSNRATAPAITDAPELDRDIAGLGAGARVIIEFEVTVKSQRDQIAWAYADRAYGTGEVIEGDETNNVGSEDGTGWDVVPSFVTPFNGGCSAASRGGGRPPFEQATWALVWLGGLVTAGWAVVRGRRRRRPKTAGARLRFPSWPPLVLLLMLVLAGCSGRARGAGWSPASSIPPALSIVEAPGVADAAPAPLGTVTGTLSAAGDETAAAPTAEPTSGGSPSETSATDARPKTPTEGRLPEAPTTGVFPEAPTVVPPPARGPERSYVSTGGFGARVGLLTCLWPSTGTYDPTLSVGGYYGGRPDGFMGRTAETPFELGIDIAPVVNSGDNGTETFFLVIRCDVLFEKQFSSPVWYFVTGYHAVSSFTRPQGSGGDYVGETVSGLEIGFGVHATEGRWDLRLSMTPLIYSNNVKSLAQFTFGYHF